MAVVADTTFLIDLSRGDEGAHALLDRLVEAGEAILVPTIVLAQYLGGDPPAGDIALVRQATEVLPFTESDAEAAGRVAAEAFLRGEYAGWSDTMIAGFARSRGDLAIATRNARHFPPGRVQTY